MLKLGGNIELSGFSDLDGGVMIVLKKIVGNYAKRMSEKAADFEKLHLVMKTIHAKEKSEKYEIHAKMHAKDTLMGDATDRNLFVAVDNSLKSIISGLNR